MNERLLQLRSQVDELFEWKSEIVRVQISLDSFGVQTKSIMDTNHLVFTGKTSTNVSGLTAVSLEVKVGDDSIFLPAAVN